MARNDTTSSMVDAILRFLINGGTLAAPALAPNAVQVLGKSLLRHLDTLDVSARESEYRRVLAYMRKQELVSESSEHGITITVKGRRRARKADFGDLQIPPPKKWDKVWRIVFFDIPENKRRGRNALTRKLKSLDFLQLQRSVWVHPFGCRKEIAIITHTYRLSQYVSYIETPYIDEQKTLVKRFDSLLR